MSLIIKTNFKKWKRKFKKYAKVRLKNKIFWVFFAALYKKENSIYIRSRDSQKRKEEK